MSRRTLATVIAVPLLVGLWVAAALVPVPYVTYHPGSTTDMLSETGGQERIQVAGHRAYYDDNGSLRMTTVSVTPPQDDVSIFEALTAWVSDEEAVEPYDAVYDKGETDKQSDTEGAVDMVSSQDAADRGRPHPARLRPQDHGQDPGGRPGHAGRRRPRGRRRGPPGQRKKVESADDVVKVAAEGETSSC